MKPNTTKQTFSESYRHQLLMKTIIAPSVVALMEKCLTHPLDTIIAYQQQNNMKFSKTARYVHQQYGARGFYRGLSLPLLASAPAGAILVYGSYEALKQSLFHSGVTNKTLNPLVSSFTMAFFFSIISTPIESKRIRDTFQLSVDGSLSTRATDFYHFRGFVPMAMKFMLHAPLVLAGTDLLKQTLYDYGQNSQNENLKNISNINQPYTTFMAGLILGAISQLMTTPFDVVKTKRMSDYTNPLSFGQHLSNAYQEGALFKSTTTRVFKFGAHSSIMLGSMHIMNQKFQTDEGLQQRMHR